MLTATITASPDDDIDATVITVVPIEWLSPAPENDGIYSPIDPSKPPPDIVDLARQIREEGLLEPIVISADRFIISGHRRYAAAKVARLTFVEVRQLGVSRKDDPERFVRLLAYFNSQRVKTNAERRREEVIKTKVDNAYAALMTYRERNADLSGFSESPLIQMGGRRERAAISDNKRPMLDAALKVIQDLKKYWPVSDRTIHYQLLNLRPLRHAKKPGSTYRNNRQCYCDLTDLLTRARLNGEIGWDVIADETRPFIQWKVYPEFGAFVRAQADTLFRGFRRNLMQSQPRHVEIVAEKLTVKSVVQRVAGEFHIPVTIARGYSSIQPRAALADRFVASGRDRLVLLVLSDFDPDGENIAESFANSLRDDFGVDADRITPVKVALGPEQVSRFNLPPSMEAKTSSSQWKRFNAKYGKHAYELEAIPPDALAIELRNAINGVIDQALFEHERKQEVTDAQEVEGTRQYVLKALREFGVDDGEAA